MNLYLNFSRVGSDKNLKWVEFSAGLSSDIASAIKLNDQIVAWKDRRGNKTDIQIKLGPWRLLSVDMLILGNWWG